MSLLLSNTPLVTSPAEQRAEHNDAGVHDHKQHGTAQADGKLVAYVCANVRQNADRKHWMVACLPIFFIGKCKGYRKNEQTQVCWQDGQACRATAESVVVKPLDDDDLEHTSETKNEIRTEASSWRTVLNGGRRGVGIVSRGGCGGGGGRIDGGRDCLVSFGSRHFWLLCFVLVLVYLKPLSCGVLVKNRNWNFKLWGFALLSLRYRIFLENII